MSFKECFLSTVVLTIIPVINMYDKKNKNKNYNVIVIIIMHFSSTSLNTQIQHTVQMQAMVSNDGTPNPSA